ncbi:hypothetical protein [Alteromonas halophila]|uniref:Uncharacterized protein n=1 Tax=Alteromonas halophila TaxID=516698 RepID=A0A918JR14_9ALTE|nr:hypothetical protein [Alteromonas halophila]GGW94942.1 hypothetical protein GCM10007391_31470 [Alteromonas halophila]
MSTNRKPTSPLLGWMSAGADLVSEQVEQVTDMVSKQLDATHALFEELQQRGESVDDQLRETLSPSSVFSSLQTLMMANPLFSLFSGSKKASVREQQLEVLSAKVDLLVEQVALLAAKKAAEQNASATPAKTSAGSAAQSTTKKSTSRKSSTASKSTSGTSASKAGSQSTRKRASTSTTRKRSSTGASKTSSSSGTTKASATKKAE